MPTHPRPRVGRRRDSATPAQPIQLLISDETPMGCELLRKALARSGQTFCVVVSAVSRRQIMDGMASCTVDVVLISKDLKDEPGIGFQVLSDLRAAFPRVPSILLMTSAVDDLTLNAFRNGARGVFCRDESWQTLCKCIESVHKGQVWANSAQLRSILDALATATVIRSGNQNGRARLTPREADVVNGIAEGLSNREVAGRLSLSEHTVSNYLFRIYEKLGLSSRVELVLYALKQAQPK